MPATRTSTPILPSSQTSQVFRPYSTRSRARRSNDPVVTPEYFTLDSLPTSEANVLRRTRKVRETCTPEQTAALQKLFDETNGYPTAEQKLEISRGLNKSLDSVNIWLQNARHPRDKSKIPACVRERSAANRRKGTKKSPKEKPTRKTSPNPSISSTTDDESNSSMGPSVVPSSHRSRSSLSSMAGSQQGSRSISSPMEETKNSFDRLNSDEVAALSSLLTLKTRPRNTERNHASKVGSDPIGTLLVQEASQRAHAPVPRIRQIRPHLHLQSAMACRVAASPAPLNSSWTPITYHKYNQEDDIEAARIVLAFANSNVVHQQ
ncbi:hypothetical protein CPB86DRAFT_874955 [Serendipita vermifera]|nr:hypothetical protein CPB86DRAFT_874955 [Serendipita vermifera]